MLAEKLTEFLQTYDGMLRDNREVIDVGTAFSQRNDAEKVLQLFCRFLRIGT
jgi:hypothetical protein